MSIHLLKKHPKPLHTYQTDPRLPIAKSASDRPGPDLLRRRSKIVKTNSYRAKQGKLAATNLHHATRARTTDAGSVWDAGPLPHTQTDY